MVLAHRVDYIGTADREGYVVAIPDLDVFVDYFEHVAGFVVQKRQHGCHGIGQRIAVGQNMQPQGAVDCIDVSPKIEVQPVRIFGRPITLRIIIPEFAFSKQHRIEARIG